MLINRFTLANLGFLSSPPRDCSNSTAVEPAAILKNDTEPAEGFRENATDSGPVDSGEAEDKSVEFDL